MRFDESRSRRSSPGPIRWAEGRYTLLAAGVVGLVVWFAVIVALLATGSVGPHEPAFRHPVSPPSNPGGLSTTAVGERTIMETDLMPHDLMSWLPSVPQELYAVSVFAMVLGVLSSGIAALVLAMRQRSGQTGRDLFGPGARPRRGRSMDRQRYRPSRPEDDGGDDTPEPEESGRRRIVSFMGDPPAPSDDAYGQSRYRTPRGRNGSWPREELAADEFGPGGHPGTNGWRNGNGYGNGNGGGNGKRVRPAPAIEVEAGWRWPGSPGEKPRRNGTATLAAPQTDARRAPRVSPVSLKLPGDYREYWGLVDRPFENTPDPNYYYPSSHHQEALHRLAYGVQSRKGAVMLTGEVGCGKTLLSRTLLQQLPSEKYDTAMIAAPAFEANHLLREVLYQLGIDATGTGVDLLHRLNDRLLENLRSGLDTVLIIDEAQAIKDDRMFEEIRLMLNFQLNDRFLLTLVLLGQPELKARVEAIPQLSQRIAIRHHLGPFTQAETTDYIRYRLRIASGDPAIFSDEACTLVHKEAGGIPRRINSLCDLALLVGHLGKADGIDRTVVLRAGAEITMGRRL